MVNTTIVESWKKVIISKSIHLSPDNSTPFGVRTTGRESLYMIEMSTAVHAVLDPSLGGRKQGRPSKRYASVVLCEGDAVHNNSVYKELLHLLTYSMVQSPP